MDPIANMFTQIKNAGLVGQKEAVVRYSKVNTAILEMLKNKGFITNYKVEKDADQKYPKAIVVYLKFKSNDELSFSDIKRISRPGRRIYISATKINKKARGKAEILISTSQGIMGAYEARKKGLGGELLGEII